MRTDRPTKQRARKGTGWLIEPKETGGIWHCGYKYKGKRYRWSSHSPLKSDAIGTLADGIRDIRAGTFRAVPATLTVKALADRWLDHAAKVTRDPKGYEIARTRVAHYLVPFLGRTDASRLTTDDLMDYRGWLASAKARRQRKDGTVQQTERSLTIQTQRHILSDCRALILWAEQRGLVPRGLVPKKKLLPRVPEKPLRSLSDEQQAVVRTVEEPYGFAVRIMIDSGVRWSELCRLTRDDLQNGELVVHGPTKSGKMRRVPIPGALVAEVRGHVGRLVPFEQKDDACFNRAVRLRSGVEAFSAHACRHTYGFNYMARGGNLLALKEQLGHSTVTLTEHYARPTQEFVRTDAARVMAHQG